MFHTPKIQTPTAPIAANYASSMATNNPGAAAAAAATNPTNKTSGLGTALPPTIAPKNLVGI